MVTTVRCKRQHQYPHGQMMCTSASLCICVAVLGKLFNPLSDPKEIIQQQVNKVSTPGMCSLSIIPRCLLPMAMQMASQVQTVVEREMGSNMPCMLSIGDMQSHGDMHLEDVGITIEEFIIVPASGKTRMVSNTNHRIPRCYTPDSCIVSVDALVDCMIHRDKEKWTATVLTNNGHSICAMCRDHFFCMFDPGDGIFSIGFNDAEFRQLMATYTTGAAMQQVDATLLYRTIQ